MRRREFITLLGSAAAAWPRAVRAQQIYPRFIPFLIDLPGWTGTQPAGTEHGRVSTAWRTYSRGDAGFSTSIISGTAALVAGSRAYMYIRWAHESTSTIDGFQVKTHSTPTSALISITLGTNVMFSLVFNNVSEGEAMAIAQEFDWKGIRALVNQ